MLGKLSSVSEVVAELRRLEVCKIILTRCSRIFQPGRSIITLLHNSSKVKLADGPLAGLSERIGYRM
jgi:hypothetical protein